MARKRKSDVQSRDQRLFSRSVVWMWESEAEAPGGDHILHAYRKAMMFGWTQLTDNVLVDRLLGRARNWVVCGRALCVSADGKVWMEQADMTLPSTKLLQVEGAYDRLREVVLSENQTRQVVDCGWVAQTWIGDDPTEVDPGWVYHGTELAGKRRVSGPPATVERQAIWQKYNELRRDRHG